MFSWVLLSACSPTGVLAAKSLLGALRAHVFVRLAPGHRERRSRRQCRVVDTGPIPARCWNDTLLAIADSGSQGHMLALIVLMNMDSGPWESSKFYFQAKQASETYLKVGDSDCPVFQLYLDKIMSDSGTSDKKSSPGYDAEVFASLSSAFMKKQTKVPVSRWFAFFDALESLLATWHAKLVQLLYIAISEGWVSGAQWRRVESLMKERMALTEDGDMSKEPTSNERAEVKKLRMACRNTLHFGMAMLMDETTRLTFAGIVRVAAPVRAWHGRSTAETRTMEDTLSWYVAQSKGAIFEPLRAIVTMVLDVGFWGSLGLWDGTDMRFRDPPDMLHARSEDEVVKKVFDFALALVSRRMRTVLWHCRGYLGSWPLLLDPDMQEEALSDLADISHEWAKHVPHQGGPFWAQVRRRSSLSTAPVAQVASGGFVCVGSVVGCSLFLGDWYEESKRVNSNGYNLLIVLYRPLGTTRDRQTLWHSRLWNKRSPTGGR